MSASTNSTTSNTEETSSTAPAAEAAPDTMAKRPSLMDKILRRSSRFAEDHLGAVDVPEEDTADNLEAAQPSLKEQLPSVNAAHHSQHNDFEYYVVHVDHRVSGQELNTSNEARPSLLDKLLGRASKGSSRRGSEQGRQFITPIQRSRPSITASTTFAPAVDEPAAVIAGDETETREQGANITDEAKVEDTEAEEGTTVFVRGVHWRATKEEVCNIFKDCGTITECRLPTRAGGKPTNTALVTFGGNKDAANRALELNDYSLHGSWLKVVSWPPPSEKPEGCHTVFVNNLAWSMDWECLASYFSDCGEVKRFKFGSTNSDTPYDFGYCYVEFYDSNATDKAVTKASIYDLMGRQIYVDYTLDWDDDYYAEG